MGTDRRDTASELFIVDEPGPFDPKPDETARERVALLTAKAELDEREAKRKLVGNRKARRAEAKRKRKKRGAAG